MALTIDQLNSCTTPLYFDSFTNQVYDSNILLDKMKKGGKLRFLADGGTEYRQW